MSAHLEGKLAELTVFHHEDGCSRKEKYERDLQLLKSALETDPENARYVFYLPQGAPGEGAGGKKMSPIQRFHE